MPDTNGTGKTPENASEPRSDAAKPVLRARPVKGKIDHEALSREHIARYRKIRARLAE